MIPSLKFSQFFCQDSDPSLQVHVIHQTMVEATQELLCAKDTELAEEVRCPQLMIPAQNDDASAT